MYTYIHTYIHTYMHIHLQMYSLRSLAQVDMICFRASKTVRTYPKIHHSTHAHTYSCCYHEPYVPDDLAEVKLSYFGHWAWCQNVGNCEELRLETRMLPESRIFEVSRSSGLHRPLNDKT